MYLAAAVVVTGQDVVDLLGIKLPVVGTGKPDAGLGDGQHVATGCGLGRRSTEHRAQSTAQGMHVCCLSDGERTGDHLLCQAVASANCMYSYAHGTSADYPRFETEDPAGVHG